MGIKPSLKVIKSYTSQMSGENMCSVKESTSLSSCDTQH